MNTQPSSDGIAAPDDVTGVTNTVPTYYTTTNISRVPPTALATPSHAIRDCLHRCTKVGYAKGKENGESQIRGGE